MKNVLKKLIAIQTELKCRKDKKAQNYKYRSAEDILENLKPILASTNCTIIISDDVEVIGTETYYKSTITLYDCESEESIENHSYVKEWEAKFMSVWQYSWATISYCRKYALCWLFSIDDWEDLDSVEDKKEEKKVEIKKVSPEKSKQHLEAFKKACETLDTGDKQAVEDLLWKGRLLLPILQEEDKKELTEICVGIKELLDSKKENKWQ